MNFKIIRGVIFGLGLTLLIGCATQSVPLQESFWHTKKQKITVAAVKAPVPQVHQIGQQGILDLAITGAANSKLSASLKKHNLSWYHEMPQNFAGRLKQQGMEATVYSKPLEGNRKNFTRALTETNDDLLLTLELKSVGARREYTMGVIPNGGPDGYCVIVGELIDPKDKKVLWHQESEVIQKVAGEWDQPPHFQNFHNTLNNTVAEAKQEVLDSFFSGH